MTLQQALALAQQQDDTLAGLIKGIGTNVLNQTQKQYDINTEEGKARYLADKLEEARRNKLTSALKEMDVKRTVEEPKIPEAITSANYIYGVKKAPSKYNAEMNPQDIINPLARTPEAKAEQDKFYAEEAKKYKTEMDKYTPIKKTYDIETEKINSAEASKKSLQNDLDTLRNLLNTQKAWGALSPEDTSKMNDLLAKLQKRGFSADTETINKLRSGEMLDLPAVARLAPYSTPRDTEIQKMQHDDFIRKIRAAKATSRDPDASIISNLSKLVGVSEDVVRKDLTGNPNPKDVEYADQTMKQILVRFRSAIPELEDSGRINNVKQMVYDEAMRLFGDKAAANKYVSDFNNMISGR